jgi:hypothetical protein
MAASTLAAIRSKVDILWCLGDRNIRQGSDVLKSKMCLPSLNLPVLRCDSAKQLVPGHMSFYIQRCICKMTQQMVTSRSVQIPQFYSTPHNKYPQPTFSSARMLVVAIMKLPRERPNVHMNSLPPAERRHTSGELAPPFPEKKDFGLLGLQSLQKSDFGLLSHNPRRRVILDCLLHNPRRRVILGCLLHNPQRVILGCLPRNPWRRVTLGCLHRNPQGLKMNLVGIYYTLQGQSIVSA